MNFEREITCLCKVEPVSQHRIYQNGKQMDVCLVHTKQYDSSGREWVPRIRRYPPISVNAVTSLVHRLRSLVLRPI